MLLVTIVYNAEKAGLVGSTWASKTNALADEAGLLDDVNTSFTAACPRQYAAQLIYNAIFAHTVVLRDGEYTNMKLVTSAGAGADGLHGCAAGHACRHDHRDSRRARANCSTHHRNTRRTGHACAPLHDLGRGGGSGCRLQRDEH